MTPALHQYLTKTTEAAPLAVFRILFGVMMAISIIRFWLNGWIDKLYIQPDFFFSYYGFEFVKPIGIYTYSLFVICGLAAIGVALGYRYRLSIVLFFISFTYIELMDKTTYLNHYYFISVLSFLMIFLPAGNYFSIDAAKHPHRCFQYIPRWSIDSVKLLIAIVYFYAGLAKLNSDWLVHAMPLKIWLPSNYHLPILGDLLQQSWVHYAMSWSGALYDLSIPFLLIFRRTRMVGFVLVVLFHSLTRVLFPIGMFPYIMIASALIFFHSDFHHRALSILSRFLNIAKKQFDNGQQLLFQNNWTQKLRMTVMFLFFAAQLLIPFRHLLYPGELFWTEEGFRFSWRVMLMEKAGHAVFKIVKPSDGKWFYVDNSQFLSSFQEKQMATQPDFMLEYAKYLDVHFSEIHGENVQVFVDSHVALNGRVSRPYIDHSIDLSQEQESFFHKPWILPFEDEIKGL